ncbi:sulfatase-like hydrolase/transferase [Roseiconus nitratireducens]|uniref:Sulfatase-like hydrolase/transferase n=1 Tax=Roseiconus nitratireducens TaxID=2605748 RepID=A0A5M6DNN6_9BACT|nr:sulfatase-like hydrolase/transferase [Roseiconus nitratireducens]KAA5547045.1 sulfatase-like hydrolase/transferase [Roseiconus nitratireducens]
MTDRWLFLKLLALGVLIASRCHADQRDVRPNVVLILADDMGVGDFASLNGGRSRTPHLDRLKSEGVWFSQAYSASPVCAPARAAMLTGRYPHRTGVVTLNMKTYPELTRIRKDETTLADVFQQNGYATGIIGKWHSGLGAPYHPLERGFDEFQGFRTHTDVPSYFNYQLTIQRETSHVKDKYLTEDLTNRAIDFVRRHREQPFFLHLAHYAPHRPIGAPEEQVKAFMQTGLPREVATVYAMIQLLDRGIGRLLETLDELDLSERTVVVFASDNGPDPLVESRFNLDLRGTKYTIYEGGIRVPMIFRWPGQLSPGNRNEPIHFVDLFPTLLGMCGVPVSEGLQIDGRPLSKALIDGTPFPPVRHFWQWNRGQPMYSHNAAIREGRWKLVRPYVTRSLPKSESNQPVRLYDMEADPAESDDVSSQHAQRTTRLGEALQAWCESVERDRRRPETPSEKTSD